MKEEDYVGVVADLVKKVDDATEEGRSWVLLALQDHNVHQRAGKEGTSTALGVLYRKTKVGKKTLPVCKVSDIWRKGEKGTGATKFFSGFKDPEMDTAVETLKDLKAPKIIRKF